MAKIQDCNIGEDDVRQAVKTHLVGEKYEIVDFQIGQANEATLGFLGEHVRVRVNVSINGEPKKLQYFAKKQITKNAEHRIYSEGVRCFYKEIEHYKTLFADVQDAISPKRLSEMKWHPDCFFTRDHDLVIVEDLGPAGYYMLPEGRLMPMEHLKATVRTIAKMHANQMIFEEKLAAGFCKTRSPNYMPGKGKQTIGDLYPNLIFETECSDISENHPGHKFWKAGFRSQLAVVDVMPGYSPEQKESIKQQYLKIAPQVFRWVEPSKQFRNVICHADLWGNNIMFRDTADGPEAITVDFQTTRYTPPALDLYQLLHLMEDTAFRDQHGNDIKEYYYEALTKEIAAEGFDVKNVLPRKEFDASCAFYKRYSILGQFIFPQLNYVPEDLRESFFASSEDFCRLMYEDRSQLMIESFNADEFCRARMTEAMQEIIKEFNMV